MPTAPVPCRLSVIQAREAPLAVIFRRGPSKWTQIIQWNTDSDTFEPGAWFHGQIYPERCDLSPDGTKLLYFATNYDAVNSSREKEFPTTWTAISKVPWLTVLGLWPQGTSYYGGGLFETNTKIWINPDHPGWIEIYRSESHIQPPDIEVSYEHPFWDHNWHELFRLERDGWKVIQEYLMGVPLELSGPATWEVTDFKSRIAAPITSILKKSSSKNSLSVVITTHYPWPTDEKPRTFAVEDNRRNVRIPVEGAVWADLDKQGRLIYAKVGKIFTAEIGDDDQLLSRELADFNSEKPKRTKSPQWARVW